MAPKKCKGRKKTDDKENGKRDKAATTGSTKNRAPKKKSSVASTTRAHNTRAVKAKIDNKTNEREDREDKPDDGVDYMKFKVPEIKDLLKKRNISTKGLTRKAQYVAALKKWDKQNGSSLALGDGQPAGRRQTPDGESDGDAGSPSEIQSSTDENQATNKQADTSRKRKSKDAQDDADDANEDQVQRTKRPRLSNKQKAEWGNDLKVSIAKIREVLEDGLHRLELPLEEHCARLLKKLNWCLQDLEKTIKNGLDVGLGQADTNRGAQETIPDPISEGNPPQPEVLPVPLTPNKKTRKSFQPQNLYPKFRPIEISDDPCKAWEKLRRYWSVQRGIDKRNFFKFESVDQIQQENIALALASVTEAVSENTGARYSLLDGVTLTIERISDRVSETPLVARPGAPFLFPWTVSVLELAYSVAAQTGQEIHADSVAGLADGGHTFLVRALWRNGEEALRLSFYDSLPKHLDTGEKNDEARKIIAMLKRLRWISPGTTISDKSLQHIPVAVQRASDGGNYEGNTCGFHVILNGWVVALGQERFFNKSFIPTENFYKEALYVVNLALAGCMDAKGILAFLLCKEYLLKNTALGALGAFSRTFPLRPGEIHANEDVKQRVLDIQREKSWADWRNHAELISPGKGTNGNKRTPTPMGSSPSKEEQTPTTIRARLISLSYESAHDIPDEYLEDVWKIVKEKEGVD